MKHQLSLKARARKLKEIALARAQDESGLPADTTLLPLPEIPSIHVDDNSSDMFGNLRCLGLAYLDKNGQQLEFSAGIDSGDDDDWQTSNQETEDTTPESSDSEDDILGPHLEPTIQDGGMRDYWPYPSKTVSDELWAPRVRNLPYNSADASLGCP